MRVAAHGHVCTVTCFAMPAPALVPAERPRRRRLQISRATPQLGNAPDDECYRRAPSAPRRIRRRRERSDDHRTPAFSSNSTACLTDSVAYITLAIRSAIMIVVGFSATGGTIGMIDASMTRSSSIPLTAPRVSTTDHGSEDRPSARS